MYDCVFYEITRNLYMFAKFSLYCVATRHKRVEKVIKDESHGGAKGAFCKNKREKKRKGKMSPPVFSSCAAARPSAAQTINCNLPDWLTDQDLNVTHCKHLPLVVRIVSGKTPLWRCFPVFTCPTFRCHAFSVTSRALKETLLLISSE